MAYRFVQSAKPLFKRLTSERYPCSFSFSTNPWSEDSRETSELTCLSIDSGGPTLRSQLTDSGGILLRIVTPAGLYLNDPLFGEDVRAQVPAHDATGVDPDGPF